MSIIKPTHLDILQRYDAPGLLVCGKFKVVKTIVIENEPSSLPTLVSAPLLPQPTLLVRVEESVHQVVAIILRNFKWLSFYAENCVISRSVDLHFIIYLSYRDTSSSRGKFSPSFIPLFIVMNCSTLGLSFTLGLCRLNIR